MIERLIAKGGVVRAGCKFEERGGTLSRVAVGVTSVRRWGNRLKSRRQPKAGEREEENCGGWICCLHILDSFFLPMRLTLRLQV